MHLITRNSHEVGCFELRHHILNGNFQIFLRVAEETGVDAELEQPAVSSNGEGPSAGQRMARQDDEEAGTQTCIYSTIWCTHCRVFAHAVCFYVHMLLFLLQMLPGKKKSYKKGIFQTVDQRK